VQHHTGTAILRKTITATIKKEEKDDEPTNGLTETDVHICKV